MLYIDFCKALDMVNHNLLLQKLKIYNVHEDTIAWFTSYLSDRKQCIKIYKSMSDQQPVNIGIAQGSILGPLIFLLSVNDLPLQDSLEGLNLFADDATDSAHGPTVENVEKTLQSKAKNVEKWCQANRMVVNVDKTKGMLMGSKQKLRLLPNSDNCLNIEVQGQKIEQVTSQRLLGVEIDSCLSWNDQIQKVRKTTCFKGHVKQPSTLPCNKFFM